MAIACDLFRPALISVAMLADMMAFDLPFFKGTDQYPLTLRPGFLTEDFFGFFFAIVIQFHHAPRSLVKGFLFL